MYLRKGNRVAEIFLEHYQNFLGQDEAVEQIRDPQTFFVNRLLNIKATQMLREIQDLEVKDAMFEIGEDKSSGLDGFTSAFFKSVWETVGPDICATVKEFFANGRLLKDLNCTILALIPKITTPQKVNDY